MPSVLCRETGHFCPIPRQFVSRFWIGLSWYWACPKDSVLFLETVKKKNQTGSLTDSGPGPPEQMNFFLVFFRARSGDCPRSFRLTSFDKRHRAGAGCSFRPDGRFTHFDPVKVPRPSFRSSLTPCSLFLRPQPNRTSLPS